MNIFKKYYIKLKENLLCPNYEDSKLILDILISLIAYNFIF